MKKKMRNTLAFTLSLIFIFAFAGCKNQKAATVSSTLPTSASDDANSIVRSILAESSRSAKTTKDKYKTKIDVPSSPKSLKLSDYDFKSHAAPTDSNSTGHNIIRQIPPQTNSQSHNTAEQTDDHDYDVFDDDEWGYYPEYTKLANFIKDNGQQINEDEDNIYFIEISNVDEDGTRWDYSLIYAYKDSIYIKYNIYMNGDSETIKCELEIPQDKINTYLWFDAASTDEPEKDFTTACYFKAPDFTGKEPMAFNINNGNLTEEEKTDAKDLGTNACTLMLEIFDTLIEQGKLGLNHKDFGFTSYENQIN